MAFLGRAHADLKLSEWRMAAIVQQLGGGTSRNQQQQQRMMMVVVGIFWRQRHEILGPSSSWQ